MCEPAADGSGGTEPDHTPLLHPADGIPDLSVTVRQIEAAAELLDRGHGPFAVDAERASGFRYSNRAYLIQIRRAGAGTVLIDPVSHGVDPLTALRPVAEVLSTDEWILHSADQDLPCLAEVGLRPPALYDTELAGRLAGFDRVNLATMVAAAAGLRVGQGPRRGRLVQAPAARRVAQLRGTRRGTAHRTARGDLDRSWPSKAKPIGPHRNSNIYGRGRQGGYAGGAAGPLATNVGDPSGA